MKAESFCCRWRRRAIAAKLLLSDGSALALLVLLLLLFLLLLLRPLVFALLLALQPPCRKASAGEAARRGASYCAPRSAGCSAWHVVQAAPPRRVHAERNRVERGCGAGTPSCRPCPCGSSSPFLPPFAFCACAHCRWTRFRSCWRPPLRSVTHRFRSLASKADPGLASGPACGASAVEVCREGRSACVPHPAALLATILAGGGTELSYLRYGCLKVPASRAPSLPSASHW